MTGHTQPNQNVFGRLNPSADFMGSCPLIWANVLSWAKPPETQELFIVTLNNGVRFVWRSEMTCLVPVEEGKQIRDLQPGDAVLFNGKRRTLTSIEVYG